MTPIRVSVRRLPLLLGVLTCACALPAAASADTFSIQSVAPTQISEGQAATVTVIRDAPASTRTGVELDGAPLGPIAVEFPAGSTSQTVKVTVPRTTVRLPFHRLDWTLPVHVTLGYTLERRSS